MTSHASPDAALVARIGELPRASFCMTHGGLLPANVLPVDETRPLHLLWSVERALRLETRGIEARLGLSGAQLWALRIVAEHPGITISALADRLGTHQSSASVSVKQLVAHGLVVRERAPGDRRRMALELTELGRSMLAKLPFVLIRARLEQALRAMPGHEQRELSRLFEHWLRKAAIIG